MWVNIEKTARSANIEYSTGNPVLRILPNTNNSLSLP